MSKGDVSRVNLIMDSMMGMGLNSSSSRSSRKDKDEKMKEKSKSSSSRSTSSRSTSSQSKSSSSTSTSHSSSSSSSSSSRMAAAPQKVSQSSSSTNSKPSLPERPKTFLTAEVQQPQSASSSNSSSSGYQHHLSITRPLESRTASSYYSSLQSRDHGDLESRTYTTNPSHNREADDDGDLELMDNSDAEMMMLNSDADDDDSSPNGDDPTRPRSRTITNVRDITQDLKGATIEKSTLQAPSSFRNIQVLASTGLTNPYLDKYPHPSLGPEDVMEIQLGAMKYNELPSHDAGIDICFRFASPANRVYTGPVERYARMIHTQLYEVMINYDTIKFTPANNAGTKWRLVITKNGGTSTFLWSLGRQALPPYAGCWMTDNVLLVQE